MKKVLLFILLIFTSLLTMAQFPTTQALGSPKVLVINKGGFQSDSTMVLPAFPDTMTANRSLYVNKYAGNIIRIGSDLYMRNYNASKWILINAAGDTASLSNRINLKLNISDTAAMLSKYLRKNDTASLSKRINLKIDSIRRFSDSIYAYHNGIKVFQYKDSVGNYIPSLQEVTTKGASTTNPITINKDLGVDGYGLTIYDGAVETTEFGKWSGWEIGGNPIYYPIYTSSNFDDYFRVKTYDGSGGAHTSIAMGDIGSMSNNLEISTSKISQTYPTNFNLLLPTQVGPGGSAGYNYDLQMLNSNTDYIRADTVATLRDIRSVGGGTGSGTVTSISQGYGITNSPNPIISTGTITVDTSASTGLSGKYVRISDTSNRWVNNITRTAGKDSIIFYKDGNRYAIKDSIGNTSGLVPYTGATTYVDLGANNLYTNNIFGHDIACDNGGSLLLYDSVGGGVGISMTGYTGKGVINMNSNGGTTQITSNITSSRNFYLPDSSGTAALREYTVNSITRTAGKDSIIFYVGNSRYAIKDSVGTGGGGAGSAVSYYLNGGTAASVGTYYQMSNTAVAGTNADFSLAGNGLISQWLTDVGNPNQLQIAAGNWNFEMYMSASSNGGTPAFYVELLKYNGSTFTSIASSSVVPENITGGTSIDLYLTSLAIPQTTLLATDRLAVRVYIVNSIGGRTITMHTQDSHLCQIITNFSSGISALNGLTSTTQTFSVDSSNSTFKITSSGTNHTFNIPNASASGVTRGLISNTQYTTFNNKVGFTDTTTTIATKTNVALLQTKSIAAYSFMANKTNATANATTQTFKDTSGTYTGGIAWTGTTAPSGTQNFSYRWTQVGKCVNLSVTLVYGTTGSAVTQVLMDLPADCPTPTTPTGISGASKVLFPAIGNFSNGSLASASSRAALTTNAAATGYSLVIVQGSGGATTVNFNVNYFTN